MGTEYEIKVIFDMFVEILEAKKALYADDIKVQKVIDDIIKSIETVRNGRKPH